MYSIGGVLYTLLVRMTKTKSWQRFSCRHKPALSTPSSVSNYFTEASKPQGFLAFTGGALLVNPTSEYVHIIRSNVVCVASSETYKQLNHINKFSLSNEYES